MRFAGPNSDERFLLPQITDGGLWTSITTRLKRHYKRQSSSNPTWPRVMPGLEDFECTETVTFSGPSNVSDERWHWHLATRMYSSLPPTWPGNSVSLISPSIFAVGPLPSIR